MLSSWLALPLFLLFVAPGLLYDLKTERRRPAVEETAFREASRVAVSSVAFSATAFFFLVAISKLDPGLFMDLQKFAQKPSTYLSQHFWITVRSVAYQVALALFLVLAYDYVKYNHMGAPSLRPVSVWFRVFKLDRPDGADVHVRVKLTDGSAYFGKLANFTADINGDRREISLEPPIKFRKKDAPTWNELPPSYRRMLINETQIAIMQVEYHDPATPARPLRLRFRSPIYRG